MKIVVALDSFKGTIRSLEACQIVKSALLSVEPNLDISILPMADGGEGTVEVMLNNKGGQWIGQTVTGPLPMMQVEAGYAWFEDSTALVEMASASGIELLGHEQLNPFKTTTYGTGQLIKAAIEKGAKKVYLAVGGSATVDGGVGAAMALGWRFLDKNEIEIPLGGAGLAQIMKIVKPDDLKLPSIEVLCDVDNPLCGPRGAANVYGPQKGATPPMVQHLEKNLNHLCDSVKSQLGRDIKDIPGAGAAGGLAAGAMAFMDAELVSGIETIIKESNLQQEMDGSDWVITGEGSFDHQSLMGKVISGIAKTAQKTNTKVAVIAGQVKVSRDEYKKEGVEVAISCKKTDMSVEEAIANSRDLLRVASLEFAQDQIVSSG